MSCTGSGRRAARVVDRRRVKGPTVDRDAPLLHAAGGGRRGVRSRRGVRTHRVARHPSTRAHAPRRAREPTSKASSRHEPQPREHQQQPRDTDALEESFFTSLKLA